MSITVTEAFGPRAPRSSTETQDWKRTYVRTFQLLTDDKTIGPREVRLALPVAIGQAYSTSTESDAGSFCIKRSVTEDTQADDGCQWIGTCEYGPFEPLEKPANPLDEQPQMNWSWAQFQRICFEDIDGDAIVNSAGDYFDPPIEVDDSRPVLRLVRNEATFDPELVDEHRDATNAAAWFGVAAGRWKVSNITADRVKHPDIGWYYVVTYEFALKREGWKRRELDQGMSELNTAGDKKTRILDAKGAPAANPWPLNDDGTKKNPGEAADFLEFTVYPEKDFTVFNFDTFFTTLTGS